MITCKRCGNASPAGAVNCQTCGAPLSSNIESEFGPSRMAAPQEQPELPTWLESLRAGERPIASVNNPSTFSTADLIEEGALPSWMRSGRQEANDMSASSPHPALRSSAMAGPNTDDSKGINAKSLIDEKALPSWIHENKQATGPIPQGGIPASSLVQPDFSPDWMRSLQEAPISNSAMPTMPPEQAAPQGQYEPAGRPGEATPQQGFSAGDLIDQRSLPQWMGGQEGKNMQPEVGPAAPGSLSPSSLLDMDSLPEWLRGSPQNGGFPPPQQASVPPAPNQAPWPSPSQMQTPPLQQSPTWQSAPQQPVGMNNAPGAVNNLPASSFIDPNALPDWLQSAGAGQPQNPGAGYNVPSRVENVRVPSRPRGEVNPNEGNEAAANVFASMLGVASSAPNLPGAPNGMQGGQMTQMPGQGTGGLQNPQQPQSYPPGGFNSGIYQTGNPGPQGGYQTGNLGPQGSYQMGNAQAGMNQYPMGGPSMPPMPNGAGMHGGEMGADQRSSTKPAKKGFFETIRDWFR